MSNALLKTENELPMMPTEISNLDKALIEKAKNLVVETAEDCKFAKNLFRQIRLHMKEFKKELDETCDGFHKQWKASTTRRATLLKPYEDGQKAVEGKYLAFDAEQERLRILAEIEKNKLAQKQQEDNLLAHAESLEKAGNSGAALAVLNAPNFYTPPVVVQAEDTSVEGVSTRQYWYAEVIDPMALVKAIAEGRASIEAIEWNMTYLNGQADKFKEMLSIDGVVAKNRTGSIVR